jgi:hypothetical protein
LSHEPPEIQKPLRGTGQNRGCDNTLSQTFSVEAVNEALLGRKWASRQRLGT